MEDYAELSAQKRNVPFANGPEVVSADLSLALFERIFRNHRPYDGRFSRADLSDDIDEIACVYHEVQPVNHRCLPVNYVRVLEFD